MHADVIWDNCSEGETQLSESVQYESTRVIITGAIKGTSATVGCCRLTLHWSNLV
jgi:hypothetical protein